MADLVCYAITQFSIVPHVRRRGIFLLSRNDEESFNKFSSSDPEPDPEHRRGGRSHVDNTSCVKNQSQSVP